MMPHSLFQNALYFINGKNNFQSDQVTLVFAESYLNNPSSIFGHTFLRFDKKNNTKTNSHLTSNTVSYVAENSSISGIYDYLIGGLIKGLPGVIVTTPYYRKLKEYSVIENRDIWEYILEMNSKEIEILISHIWELKDKRFDYYFIDENCSYRIISMLEAAKFNLDITKTFSLRTIPIETIKALDDAGMIKEFNYRPSSIKLFNFHANQLDESSRDYIRKLSTSEYIIDENDINIIPNINKTLMAAGRISHDNDK